MSDPLRFFVPPEALLVEHASLEGDVHHHLRNVLRAQVGERVLLLDGQGGCREVEITEISAKRSETRTIHSWQQSRQGLSITLMQALPKGDKLDLVLQKGTELGVARFQPLVTAHSVPNLNETRRTKRAQRWQRIISEAARQSRCVFLPELDGLSPLSSALEEDSPALKLVLWEAGSVPLATALPAKPPGEVKLLVGPEGGFAKAEIDMIQTAGYQPVHLGPRILRTETAGLAATPILQYLYGDWQQAPADYNETMPEETL